MSVKQLPHGIVKLISSTQVISSVASVIKELVENSIDADATVIDIKLEKYGLEKIEVRDNGAGINTSDIHFVCKPNHTSKIHSMEDLETLESYGFRGEALNSICAVSQLRITTRTEQDEIASVYTFDSNGTVRDSQPSHQMRGSIVTVVNIFKNVPVRRQFYENTRKAIEELKKIEKIVKMLSVIHPKLRMTISHNKCLIWHKTAVTTLKQSLMQMYPHVVLKNLEYFSHSVDNFSLEMLICKRDCNWSVLCQPLNEAILFFINQRPVKDKRVEKVVMEEMLYLFQSALPSNKCPLTLIALKLPPQELDVNLEPDKTKVFIKNHEDVLKQIRECMMLHFYKQPIREIKPEGEQTDKLDEENPPKKPKLDSECRRINSSHDIVYEETFLDNLQNVSSVLMGGDENINVAVSTVNDPHSKCEDCGTSSLENFEFEDCDAFENLLKETESALQQPTNVGFRSCKLKSINSVQQVANMSNNTVQRSTNTDFESKLAQQSVSVDRESMVSVSMVQESEANLLKYFDITKPRTSSSSETRLSISGNLVDVLFQSQITDSEEIHLENSQNSITNTEAYKNESSIQNSVFSSTEERREISRTENNADVDAQIGLNSLDGNIKSLGTELDMRFTVSEETPNSSKDGDQLNMRKSNLTQATLSQWSKGHVLVNNQPLEGASVLREGKCNENKDLKQSPCPLERSVSSQMGRKSLAGLTNFARSARLELIENYPGMSFTRVASELAKRWRNFDDSQKNEYAEKAKTKNVQKVTSTSEVTNSKPFIKKQKVLCDTSINAIKTRLLQFKKNKVNDVRIIKFLQSEDWYLCRIIQTVALVNVHHLQRNVLFHRYLCYSNMSSRCVDEPLEITEELVENEYFTFLQSLERSDNGDDTVSISDPRILKNGFKIVITGEANMWLTGVAEELADNYVEELIETLRLAVFNKDMRSCRPEKIQMILREKAFDACRNKNVGSDDVEVLLEYWVQRMSQQKCTSSSEEVSVKLFSL